MTPNICLWFIWAILSSVVWCNNEGKMKIQGSITATGTIKNFAKDSRKTVELATDIKNMLNGMCTHRKSQDNNQNIEDKFQNITTDMDAIKEKLDIIQDIVSGDNRECSDTPRRVGVYNISPDDSHTFKVKCEAGGWTVIQKRFNGSTDFYRNWLDYENGFGDLNEEFWLGNKNIALLTSRRNHELRIDLEDWEGRKAYALFKSFKVGDQSTNYTLTISGYSGNAGDSMTYHNNMPFSTYDRDNDKATNSNCADYSGLKGAWWYNACWRSNLNGKYSHTSSSGGIKYAAWRGYSKTMKKSSMMIKRTKK
ncbi:microfibril-associated glycoprotein 4-like isoform X2 [Mytilus trossulus]|uniref:microfibril-associated glycoprotein 4-like isoform X2 n=1 Tax=Mytilus trossulus TaxID=6551 RepID=UPI0030059161